MNDVAKEARSEHPRPTTFAGIIAEMREHIAMKMSDAWYTQDEWRNLCDRLEAAWKREWEHAGNSDRLGNETTTDISAEIGEMSDYCHNNIESKTWVDWEKMHEWLLDIRRRIETAVLRKAIELSKRLVPGNAAAMHEALKAINCINTGGLKRLLVELVESDIFDGGLINKTISAVEKAKRALSTPARNCDRFTDETDAQIAFLNEVWLISVDRKTMLVRDKYENWSDEMRAKYGRWLLSPAAERKG